MKCEECGKVFKVEVKDIPRYAPNMFRACECGAWVELPDCLA